MFKKIKEQKGVYTLEFVFGVFWLIVTLLIFIAVLSYIQAYTVTSYAAFTSGRVRMVEGIGSDTNYRNVARNIVYNMMPKDSVKLFLCQEVPLLGVSVAWFYKLKFFPLPMPVGGNSPIPYSKLNPSNPSHYIWKYGDNK